jgi:hypothetical protein
MVAKAQIYIDPQAFASANRLLDELDGMARGPAIKRVLKKAGQITVAKAKEILPKPGDPGDKKELKPLRDTVEVKTVSFQGGAIQVMIVGYAWPTGNHGQLVEEGHKMVLWGEEIEGGRVEPHPYFKTAIDRSQAAVQQAIIDGARSEADKVLAASLY